MTNELRRIIETGDGTRVSFTQRAGLRLVTVSSRVRPQVARVLAIHGLGDHAGRHIAHARRLAAAGFTTTMVELAGHGGQPGEWPETMAVYEAYARSDRPADLLSYFRDERAFPQAYREHLANRQYARLAGTSAIEHLAQVSAAIEQLDHIDAGTAGLPLFVLGHSMGALLAHETMFRIPARARARIAGLVLIAPAFAPQGNPASPAMQLAVNGLWSLRRFPVSPTRTAAKALLDLNFPVDTTWGKKWLTDVDIEVELFVTDPLVPRRLPTRYANSIESLMAAASRRGARVPYDAVVLLPARDGITSRGAAVDFVRRANHAAGTTRVSMATFDVVAHDLLRSSARDGALSAIEQWLDGRAHARAA